LDRGGIPCRELLRAQAAAAGAQACYQRKEASPPDFRTPPNMGAVFHRLVFPQGAKGGYPWKAILRAWIQSKIDKVSSVRFSAADGEQLRPRLVTDGRHTWRTCPSTVAACATTAKPVWCELGAMRILPESPLGQIRETRRILQWQQCAYEQHRWRPIKPESGPCRSARRDCGWGFREHR
jgi:hypothetical protein